MRHFRDCSIRILIFLLFYSCTSSSTPRPRVSPRATVSQTLGDLTKITINYNRPGVKGRIIWGELVPFNEVWRTGANEATTITFNNDLLIEGSKLKSGTYSLFTIPSENEWTVIFNNIADQWGAFNYDTKEDALSIKVKSGKSPHEEWMRFSFEALNSNSARITLVWEKIEIGFNVEVETKAEEPRVSQMADVSQTFGDSTKVNITYSRPGVKGRTIWGNLVPYDEVWRTGANENTKISFSDAVMIEGEKLSAGVYGLHTIPGKSGWIVIFSHNSTSWGSFSYKQEEDALRINVIPQKTEIHKEWLRFSFPVLSPGSDKVINSGEMVLHWENLKIPIRIKTL